MKSEAGSNCSHQSSMPRISREAWPMAQSIRSQRAATRMTRMICTGEVYEEAKKRGSQESNQNLIGVRSDSSIADLQRKICKFANRQIAQFGKLTLSA